MRQEPGPVRFDMALVGSRDVLQEQLRTLFDFFVGV